MRLRHALAILMVLGAGIDLLAACSSASREQVQKATEAARQELNRYCDARAMDEQEDGP